MTNIFLYNKHITDEQRKRTVKLLYSIRMNYGVDRFFLARKLLMISLIIHYYQSEFYKKYYSLPWISYETFLERLESNHLYGNRFLSLFGFQIKNIKSWSMQKLMDMTIERCKKEMKEY